MSPDQSQVRLFDSHGDVREASLDHQTGLGRDESQLLWIDLLSADRSHLDQAAQAVGISPEALDDLLSDDQEDGWLDDQGGMVAAHAYTLERTGDGYDREPLDIAAGPNWVITSHGQAAATIDDFAARLKTSRRVGDLDGASFLAFLLDWLFTRYMGEIEALDREIDELDLEILRSDADDDLLTSIANLRRRVAAIRRALASHRELVTWPSHTEFSEAMTDRAQQHFTAVAERFSQAMASIDTTRDSLNGCFDLLMSRVAQRTNSTMRVLTVVSVSLLPATLLTGILGMNFHPSFFDHPSYFWVVLAAISTIVLGALAAARKYRWI